MADTLPTVWKAEPHTLAKHAILRRYLGAWFAILAHQTKAVGSRGNAILYVDGFAGPGEYEGGEPGSPLIALRAALDHQQRLPVEVRFVFIEARRDRHQHLTDMLARFPLDSAVRPDVRIQPPVLGECDVELDRILREHDASGARFGPALVFLDQFGYSAIPIELIARIMRIPACEVFSLLEYREIDRFMSDSTKHAGLDRAFGGSEWRECMSAPPNKIAMCFRDRYVQALQGRGRAKYVINFTMYDMSARPLYWLFFCTNHLRGLEEMKRAMRTVDKSGAFRFSDRDLPGQLNFLDSFDDRWLARELAREFHGKKTTVGEVGEFVLIHTPCHNYKAALRILEKEAALEVHSRAPTRKPGTFPDARLEIQFKVQKEQ
jgi:three-Cys-motif partner protein